MITTALIYVGSVTVVLILVGLISGFLADLKVFGFARAVGSLLVMLARYVLVLAVCAAGHWLAVMVFS